jgi:hypothetical protein
MTLLKHQRQKYNDSCGPTCVAIIAGTTQSRAILAMFCQRRDRFCHSWIPDIIRGLDELGIKHDSRERSVTDWKSIRDLSIVSVRDDEHWVVYSPKEALVYDPGRKAPVPISKFRGKPVYYLKVWPTP